MLLIMQRVVPSWHLVGTLLGIDRGQERSCQSLGLDDRATKSRLLSLPIDGQLRFKRVSTVHFLIGHKGCRQSDLRRLEVVGKGRSKVLGKGWQARGE